MPGEKGGTENVSLSRRTVVRRVEDIASDPELHLQHRGVDFDFYSLVLDERYFILYSYRIFSFIDYRLQCKTTRFPLGENKY